MAAISESPRSPVQLSAIHTTKALFKVFASLFGTLWLCQDITTCNQLCHDVYT